MMMMILWDMYITNICNAQIKTIHLCDTYVVFSLLFFFQNYLNHFKLYKFYENGMYYVLNEDLG